MRENKINKRLFTSESVTEGHPDKMCDAVSDAVLDAIISNDKNAHVACETVMTTGLILVVGEISTDCYADIPALARSTVKEIGYDRAKYGFDADTCAVLTAINEQSGDIAMGVNNGAEYRKSKEEYDRIGAGDQGMIFGYACDETETLMPLPITLAHRLAKRLSEVRKSGTLDFLRPDGKTQVTVEYENDVPVRIDTVVVSAQHAPDIEHGQIYTEILDKVIKPIIPANLFKDTKIYVNPTGRFVTGGPSGDSGLTGRKIIVDTYGGYCRSGGGAFSGKDPTKVDRSAAYMARYAAKNMVLAGLAKRLEIQIAYAIGVANPVSYTVDSFGTGKVSDGELENILRREFDFRPRAIIDFLDLCRPIYRATSSYGHFGREEFPWEKINADFLNKYKK